MAEKLIEVTRGQIVESIHHGDAAVVDNMGRLLYSVGNPYKISYPRSAGKPLQALNVILTGAAQRFAITDQEIAIMCASHYAEKFHLATVQGILEKIGLDYSHILGGTVTSYNPRYALQLAWDHAELNPLYSTCSGKHSGMLSVCRHKSYSLPDYLSPAHPCQIEIKNIIARMCEVDISKMSTGIDGCSAPVYAFPIYNLALGYARIANPENLDSDYKNAAKTVFNSMVSHPEMIAGTGGFCSDLIKFSNGKLIGKIGTDGVYCVGVKERNLAFAIKVESGSMAVIPPVVIKILKKFDILSGDELYNLRKYEVMDNLNDVNTVIGQIQAVFR